MNEETRKFIAQHAGDDVRKLALSGSREPEVDMATALQQIAGRQAARNKLPQWAACDRLLYPPHLNIEQCSSEQTARYKSRLVREKITEGTLQNGTFADLTGGFGVDFYWISQLFTERHYVERDRQLHAISTENFRLLNHHCNTHCCTAEEFLAATGHCDLTFLDPARRDKNGGRTYGIADCTPNVIELLPQLMQKSSLVMLKLSPMLDWHKAVSDLKSVSEVHIVSVANECKELLVLLSKKANGRPRLFCVNDGSVFTCMATDNDNGSSGYCKTGGGFLYEPNASIMKAGCFDELTRQFAVSKLADNSHLFVADSEIMQFPGRRFSVCSVSSMNKQELKEKLTDSIDGKTVPLKSANVSIRNFPMTAEQLRKKLKLKDGGNIYIFATTLRDGSHKLFICRKIG